MEAMGWQDLPSTMVRAGRQSCTRGCVSWTPAPLQSEGRLQRSIKMHELVLTEPAGIGHGRLWQLGACCVHLPLEQRTGEMQGDGRACGQRRAVLEMERREGASSCTNCGAQRATKGPTLAAAPCVPPCTPLGIPLLLITLATIHQQR